MQHGANSTRRCLSSPDRQLVQLAPKAWPLETSLPVKVFLQTARLLIVEREDKFYGREFDWFATDRLGHIALCSTAGFGEIPLRVIKQSTPENSPIDYLDQLVADLGVIGQYKVCDPGPCQCTQWRDLASRGFFVYDWKHWSGPFQRILIPDTPINSHTIPEALWTALRAVSFPTLSFENCASFEGHTVAHLK